MQHSEDIPDEVPVTDAVEQQQEVVEPVAEEESPAETTQGPPLEATEADWRQQSENVDLDPEFEGLDRDT
jgi:hypothetical protein